MRPMRRALVLGGCIVALLTACASGRVRGAQGTEMKQAEEYEPQKKVDPPEGNIFRETDTYPMLEIDLERRRPPPGPGPEPEPEPQPKSERGNAAE